MRYRKLGFSGAVCMALAVGCSTSDDKGSDPCAPDDADGVVGGAVTFAVKVDDIAFQPTILKAQNAATITLTLTNAGAKPHGFAIDCLPTPNSNSCSTASCFPAEANIAAIAPGATANATFKTPRVEGIYTIRSNVPGDAFTAQFILQ